MGSRAEGGGFDSLLRSLAARRFVVYAGGLAVIVLPRVLQAAVGIEVPAAIRTILVVVGLGAMILTYLGERRADTEDTAGRPRRAEPSEADAMDATGATEGSERGSSGPRLAGESEYSRRTRTTIAMGLTGIAIGIYVAVEIDTIIGVLFVIGGLLFGGSAYRTDGGEAG
jgi:hypothetical protein